MPSQLDKFKNSILSNEKTKYFIEWSKQMKKKGGYLGVGFLQNLTYVGLLNPSYCVLVDLSPKVSQLIQTIVKHIGKSRDYVDFVNWWTSQDDEQLYRHFKVSQKFDPAGWLLTPPLFLKVKELVDKKRVHIINGDLTERKTQKKIIRLKKKYKKSVTVCYLSNIFSTYGRLVRYSMNYKNAQKIFGSTLFNKKAIFYLTSEIFPKELKEEAYHYSCISSKNFNFILKQNKTLDEFLAFYMHVALKLGQGATSYLIDPFKPSQLNKPLYNLKQVQAKIQKNQEWYSWSYYKQHFLLKRN